MSRSGQAVRKKEEASGTKPLQNVSGGLQAGLPNLDRLIQFLGQYPENTISIEGHTDSRGADDFNIRLSQARADAVRRALIGRGVSADRLQSVGLGEEFPLASNELESGRQQNRRVEIIILNKGQG